MKQQGTPHVLVVSGGSALGSDLCSELASDFKLERRSAIGLLDEASEGTMPEVCDALLLETESIPLGERASWVRRILEHVTSRDPALRAIVLVSPDDDEVARAAIAAGAWDVVAAPPAAAEIGARLRAASRLKQLQEAASAPCAPSALRSSGPSPAPAAACDEMLGESPAMQRVFRWVQRVASTDVPVLIVGESGTGKELAAVSIHRRSRRAGGPFVEINCGAIPETLLESELFGWEKGAFTGATRSHRGRFQAAEGGTLFLDEVGELAPPLQVKLLRFLEDHVVEPVGSLRRISIDVRIIAATNRDLAEAIRSGAFREDLYYRLAVFTLAMPPLREREGDMLLLACHFLAHYGAEAGRPHVRFRRDAVQALQRAEWPGNVRELINRVRRALVVTDGLEIAAADLGFEGERPEAVPRLREVRARAESRCIEEALRRHGWRKCETARALGISRTRLYELMRSHGLLAPPS